MVAAAGACLSTGGLIVRYTDAVNGWQILFYRSTAFTITVLIFITVRYRGDLRTPFSRISWGGIIVALSLGISFTCYLFGILYTTVANVVFIISSGPFFAALLGWLVLGESVPISTWLAMTTALFGIAIMFADGLGTGGTLGNIIALGMPLSFAVMVVTLRRYRHVDMLPATCLAGVVAALIAAPMMGNFAISEHNFGLAVLMGTVQVGAGFILITLGSRYLPSTDIALLALTETMLAPLWVWIFIAEAPSLPALVGGVIVFCAVAGQALWSAYRMRQSN